MLHLHLGWLYYLYATVVCDVFPRIDHNVVVHIRFAVKIDREVGILHNLRHTDEFIKNPETGNTQPV